VFHRVSPEQILGLMKGQGYYNEESLAFMGRMLQQSGCGPKTAWPPGIIRCFAGEKLEQDSEESRREAEIVIFDCVRKVMKQTKYKAKDIDILIINCSLFSPTPSLCSMVINEFGLKGDISSYNLSGMGCSAGLISIELAKNLLNAKPDSIALVVSTEIITPNLYHGNERGFLLQNTLFRCGGAAMILSNKWTDGFRANFKLLHVVRTQYVSEDSYGCVYETNDSLHNRGVRLSKEIVKVAGRALEKNLTSMGPYVLPISEQAKVAYAMLAKFIAKKFGVSVVYCGYLIIFERS
jgi:predicted naringenin-chalcone synthase